MSETQPCPWCGESTSEGSFRDCGEDCPCLVCNICDWWGSTS